ncbi:MAG: zf-TFIIB domain-containing protein [Longispora sp.]|nr:zf-TFIIB domain-containing protein [Longispora sp. (in: high G+C Gram-positive bacteria)]
MQCPKCHGVMRTHNRSGIHIEQCDSCRGVYLDYGELESLSQVEARWTQQAPPPQPPANYPPPAHGQPAWGAQPHGYPGHYKKKGFAKFLFSS